MAAYKDLENLIGKYIAAGVPASSTFRQQLESPTCTADLRYQLLMGVRGVTCRKETGLLVGAAIQDLDGLKSMLNGLASEQKYDVLKLANWSYVTPLHAAVTADNSSITSTAQYNSREIVDYLFHSLSAEQKFNLLKMQTTLGQTVLHIAMDHKKTGTIQLIMSSLTYEQQRKLMRIKNNNGKSSVNFLEPMLFHMMGELRVAQTNVKERKDELQEHQREKLQLRERCEQQARQITQQAKAIHQMGERQTELESFVERFKTILASKTTTATDETGDVPNEGE